MSKSNTLTKSRKLKDAERISGYSEDQKELDMVVHTCNEDTPDTEARGFL